MPSKTKRPIPTEKIAAVQFTPVDIVEVAAMLDKKMDEARAEYLFRQWSKLVKPNEQLVDITWAMAQMLSNVLITIKNPDDATFILRTFITMTFLASAEQREVLNEMGGLRPRPKTDLN